MRRCCLARGESTVHQGARQIRYNAHVCRVRGHKRREYWLHIVSQNFSKVVGQTVSSPRVAAQRRVIIAEIAARLDDGWLQSGLLTVYRAPFSQAGPHTVRGGQPYGYQRELPGCAVTLLQALAKDVRKVDQREGTCRKCRQPRWSQLMQLGSSCVEVGPEQHSSQSCRTRQHRDEISALWLVSGGQCKSALVNDCAS